MATRSKKPKCDGSTSQSCGMGCISREHTCRELIAADVATKLLTVAKQHQQPNDAAGQAFDAVAANFPPKLLAKAHKTGVATSDLGDGAVLTTKLATGLDGSSIKYGFVTDADGKRYTVSDGLVKEVTSAVGSEWQEAFDAAVRSKVALSLAESAGTSATLATSAKAPVASVAKAPVASVAKAEVYLEVPGSQLIGKKLLVSDDPVDKKLIKKAAKDNKIKIDTAKAKLIADVVGDPPGGEGLAIWLSDDYKAISPIMYTDAEDYDKVDVGLRAIALGAVKALASLPSASEANLNSPKTDMSRLNRPAATAADMLKLSRFAALPDKVLAKYKVGEIVEEQTAFGTSYLSEETFGAFAIADSNVKYSIKSKGFDKTNGKAVDLFKSKLFEGEVLFPPGTRFKVLAVTQPIELTTMKPAFASVESWTVFNKDIKRYDHDSDFIAANGSRFKIREIDQALQDKDFAKIRLFDPDSQQSSTTGLVLSSKAFRSRFVSQLTPVKSLRLDSMDIRGLGIVGQDFSGALLSGLKREMSNDSALDLDKVYKMAEQKAEKQDLTKAIADAKLDKILEVNEYGKLSLTYKSAKDLQKAARTTIFLEEVD